MAVKPLHDESELLAKIARGDQRAFKRIYENYHSYIYRFSLHYLKSEMDAEEVVQEVFLKLWMRDSRSLPIGNLLGYLQTLARNRSLNMLRQKARANSTDLEAAMDWTEQHEETEQQILLNDTRKVLSEGIELLPPQQRMVYQLCQVEGLKYEDAARELNIAPGTVHSHVKAALRFLREHMRRNTDIAVMMTIFKLFS